MNEKKEALRMEILKYIEKHSRVELGELAVLVGVEETDVANEIADMEKEKIICGYPMRRKKNPMPGRSLRSKVFCKMKPTSATVYTISRPISLIKTRKRCASRKKNGFGWKIPMRRSSAGMCLSRCKSRLPAADGSRRMPQRRFSPVL